MPLGPTAFQPGYVYVCDPMNESGVNGRISAFPNLVFDDLRILSPSSLGEVMGPQGAAFDSQGRMVIADANLHRLVRVDDMTATNRVEFGAQGAGTNQFDSPLDVAVDGSDRIYVADFFNQRIVRMDDMSGTNWTALNQASAGNFGQPRNVKLDNGKIYILTILGMVVQVDDMNGTNAAIYQPTGAETFNNPIGLAIDASHRIYIADSANHRIVRIDNISGANRVEFGTQGSGTGKFKFPQGLTIDAQGRILIVDSGNGRIVRMDDMNGTNWVSLGKSGTGQTRFNTPSGIVVR